jgi:hypothetical protein
MAGVLADCDGGCGRSLSAWDCEDMDGLELCEHIMKTFPELRA